MIVAGSFHGTRTTGTVSVWEMACSIGQTSFMSVNPCCMSITRASKPWRAITSAVKPWDTESQPSVAHLLSRQICLILFGRTVAPRLWCGRSPGGQAQRSTSRRGTGAAPQPLVVGSRSLHLEDVVHVRVEMPGQPAHRLE